MITRDIKDAILCCISKNIPFALYALPQNDNVTFFANPSSPEESKAYFDGRKEFIVNFFNNDYPYDVSIAPEMSATELLEIYNEIPPKKSPEISPWTCSTNYLQYCSQVHQIVQMLRRYGGKTVLSRVITGKFSGDWADVIEYYFMLNRNSFRYAYMTRESGCWLGATPEVLLECQNDKGMIETMALAGTRQKSKSKEPWDQKNIEEHNYVTEYIVNSLADLGLSAKVSEMETIGYGAIEHICHRISAYNEVIPANIILRKLSPTPAVAGFPIDAALEDIQNFEVHPRYCYAGYVGICDEKGTHIYVNLRCVHFSQERFCIYGGGGLTALSREEEEWQEVEAKTAGLRNLLI